VHVAPTGEAGLALVERHGADLDLIITELELPDLTGGEVAAIIAQYRPWLPVLYVGTSSVAPSPARSRPFLPKPFHPGDLEAAASRLLSRHAARRREMEALWRRATDAVEDTRRAMASNLAARGAMWQQLAQTGQLVAAGRELRRQERGSSGD
jgi:CheY-like chemotaxis protein